MAHVDAASTKHIATRRFLGKVCCSKVVGAYQSCVASTKQPFGSVFSSRTCGQDFSLEEVSQHESHKAEEA